MFGKGMGNMTGMMKKVQKMQADMKKMQEELKTRTVEASVGGGADGLMIEVHNNPEKHYAMVHNPYVQINLPLWQTKCSPYVMH